MMTRYGVWLDGLPLHEIDPAIYITDIQEQAPHMNVATVARAKGDGLFVTRRSRESLSVQVGFTIREYDTARRKSIMQKVIAWAKGGKYLSISDRPDQRLRIEVDQLPTISSSLKWTQELSIVFTAYAFPYWENTYADTITTTSNASMTVMGDADHAPVDATIEGANGTVTITADKTTITLENVSGSVEISHGDDGILRIMAGGQSILSKRTPESSDDLIATPGRLNDFIVSGGTATFRVRGVWA